MHQLSDADYNGTDLEALRGLPVNVRVYSSFKGMGCAFDPPGYPSYHLSSYDQRSHPYACIYYITYPYPDGQNYELGRNEYPNEILKRLWKPYPLDNPRVRSWIMDVYRHWQHCWDRFDVGGVLNAADWLCTEWVEDAEKRPSWMTLDRYGAVRYIRKFYPDYDPQPDFEYVLHPPVYSKETPLNY